ncbi:hypothetical protein H8D76_00260 [Candidatus Bathyarchaeota archaeon]|nr:hypothetical protein [Candidatus Bathyarchaeota archaeon]
MSLKFSEKTVTIEEKTLHGSICELENAVLAFFWVGEKPKLGGLSVTLPDRSSSQLLGDRGEMLSRMIGERIASGFDKIALVSTNLPMGFEGKPVLGLLNELLNDGKE